MFTATRHQIAPLFYDVNIILNFVQFLLHSVQNYDMMDILNNVQNKEQEI
jgi:hypothetical protein